MAKLNDPEFEALFAAEPELRAMCDRVALYFEFLHRPLAWSPWTDATGTDWLRLRVELPVATQEAGLHALSIWIERAAEGWLLLVDAADEERPTLFARRTYQVFAPGEYGLGRMRHRIIAMLS